MLVQFRFKNFGPFKQETVFDMRAVKAYKEHPSNLISLDNADDVVHVAAIYGANASGKSNFVDAYSCFVDIIINSFSDSNENDQDVAIEHYWNPFLFIENASGTPTEFEAVYTDDRFEYQYGFIYDTNSILYEWFYRTSLSAKQKRKNVILERSPNNSFRLGVLSKECEIYIKNIENNVLALSFFSKLKLRTTIFKSLRSEITAILPIHFTNEIFYNNRLKRFFGSDQFLNEKNVLLLFLSAIDVGISDIEVERNKDKVMVYSIHIGPDDNKYRVPFEIESDGTKKAIAIFSLVITAIQKGLGLIIDELNSQMHPLLFKFIVDLFYTNSSSAQLIFTTHDTFLLDKRYMRRDQIWFTNKAKDGISSLYSLSDFKVRNDASFEKDYLSGSFGAIPILQDYSFEEDEANGNG